MVVLNVCGNYITKYKDSINVFYNEEELNKFLIINPPKIIFTNTFLSNVYPICDIRLLTYLIDNLNINYFYFKSIKESFDFLNTFNDTFKDTKNYVNQAIEYTKLLSTLNNFFNFEIDKEKLFNIKEKVKLKYRKSIPEEYDYLDEIIKYEPSYNILNNYGDINGFKYDISIFNNLKKENNYIEILFENIEETMAFIYTKEYNLSKLNGLFNLFPGNYVKNQYGRIIHTNKKDNPLSFFCHSSFNDIILRLLNHLYNNNVRGVLYKDYRLIIHYTDNITGIINNEFPYLKFKVVEGETNE